MNDFGRSSRWSDFRLLAGVSTLTCVLLVTLWWSSGMGLVFLVVQLPHAEFIGVNLDCVPLCCQAWTQRGVLLCAELIWMCFWAVVRETLCSALPWS